MALKGVREKKAGAASKPAPLPSQRTLERRFWSSWFLLVGVLIATTVGLVTAMRPLLSGRDTGIWPWISTESVLYIGLSLLVLVFTAYLTYQQREAALNRSRVQQLQDQMNERTQKHYTRLLALFNVSRILGADSDPQRVFDGITNVCMEAFDCQQASLMLVNKTTGNLEVCSATGHRNLAEVLSTQQKIGEGIAGWVAERRTAIVLSTPLDAERYPGLRLTDRSVSAAMVVPIIVRDELVGVLNVSSRLPGTRYDEEDLRSLQVFAENAGACIRHTEQAQWLRQTNQKLRRNLAHENYQAAGTAQMIDKDP